MAQAPITRPYVFSTSSPWPVTRTAQSDGSNSFSSQQFVSVSSGSLALTADGATATYGLTPDASHASTDEPYTAPYGETHNVIDPLNTRFVVNVADTNAAVGTSGVTPTVGTAYGIKKCVTSGYTNVQFLNASDTSNAFFRVEGFIDPSTDLNPRVIVSVVATRQ